MTRTFLWLIALSLSLPTAFAAEPPRLWYAQPANNWSEALPLGNGHMGAMVFGGVQNEHIQFNEDTLWRGKPHDYVRAGAGDQLAEIRQLVFDGKAGEAGRLAREKFLSDPIRQLPYQPFGDLRLQFPGLENPTDYRRELDLDSAVARVSFQAGGTTYLREVFASYPDRVIVVRLTAQKPGSISFTVKMDSLHTNSETHALAGNTLALTGLVQADGLRFESRVRVFNTGGEIATNASSLTIEKADAVTLLLAAATSFKNFQDISADPAARCAEIMSKVSAKPFPSLLATHVADHQKLFRRVSLDLGRTARADLPTDQRQRQVRDGLEGDPELAALYFQYGRYLLIASSRPGSQPANLQGVWNDLLNPPWESKYTLNINAEMNYWPAELCNLSECHEPLFDLIDDLVISGGRTAQKQYGARGWVVHHNTDLWRGSAPINNVDGVWPTGGAWLCHHLWEHYQFTGDKKFLERRAYPAMKEAARFFLDFLVKDPESGYLVTVPSHSPEQTPPNRPLFTCGPTMDNQLIRALLTYTITAAQILDVDKDFAVQLGKIREQLPPNMVGQHGQLQEWLKDWDAPNNQHRHMSPLWALYPGFEITPANSNIFAATKKLLTWRGDGSTGWSYAWRIPLWARVGDGDFAFRQLAGMLQKRTLPNLFDLCGPFQIDGNFGGCAGIAELLLQSHETRAGKSKSEIYILKLLPALPKAWPTGTVKGLCARDGFEVDLKWEQGALTRAVVRSKLGNPVLLRYADQDLELTTVPGKEYVFDGKLKPLK